jgi:hypothetical protein
MKKDFFYLPPVTLTPVVHLKLQISRRIFEKIRNSRNGIHCKSEGLRKYCDQVYGTLQIALVLFFGNINKKA